MPNMQAKLKHPLPTPHSHKPVNEESWGEGILVYGRAQLTFKNTPQHFTVWQNITVMSDFGNQSLNFFHTTCTCLILEESKAPQFDLR